MKYDAAECLIDDIAEKNHEYAFLLVVPFDRPKELMDVDSVHFVFSPLINSPMGANLGAFATRDNIPESERNNTLDWKQTVETRLQK